MKKTLKKLTTAILLTALILEAAQPAHAAVPKIKREKTSKNDPDPYAYFSFPHNDARDWVYRGKILRATAHLPAGAKIKSVSLRSANQKVIKITNKNKGLMKAVKPGRSKLTLKVVWKYSGRLKNPNYKYTGQNDDYKTVTKKSGRTYTTTVRETVYVYRR